MKKLPWLRERTWVKKGGAASPTNCSRDNVIRAILFDAGFLLIIILFSEEFVRAPKWLRARLKCSPRRRIIVYPLLLLPTVVAGFIIVTSLIKFSTALTFSYDWGRVLSGESAGHCLEIIRLVILIYNLSLQIYAIRVVAGSASRRFLPYSPSKNRFIDRRYQGVPDGAWLATGLTSLCNSPA